MTTFANVQHPVEHAGVVRAENAVAALRSIASGFDGARGAASLLLAAVVSALLTRAWLSDSAPPEMLALTR